MRLGLLTPEWYAADGAGGIATYCRIFAAHAAALGNEVTVFAGTSEARGPERPAAGLEVVPVPVARGAGALDAATAFREAWRPRRHELDAIEAAEFGGVASLIAGEAPVITRLHTPLALLLERNGGSRIYRDDALRCELEARQVRASAHVTSPTAWLAGEARRLWNVAARVIPNPVERPATPPSAPPARTPLRVLYFGRLEHRKGVLCLAEAARPLIERGEVALTLAGGDTRWHGQSVAERTAGILAPATARFLPPRHGEALVALVDSADVVVLPSLFENFAYACVEAMARARCVVATGGSGFDEIVVHGRTGFLVPPGDPDALREVLAACAAGGVDLAATGRAAWGSLARFDARAVAAALCRDYAGVPKTVC